MFEKPRIFSIVSYFPYFQSVEMDPIVFSLLFTLSSHSRQLHRLLWVMLTSLSARDILLQFPPILQELPSDPMFAQENCLFVDFLS